MQNPVLIENSTMQGIANAIRTKTNTNNTMLPSQMASLITNIQSGGVNLPNNIHTGTFTVASDTIDAQTFEHGFNSAPTFLIVLIDEVTTMTSPYSIIGAVVIPGYGGICRRSSNGAPGTYTQIRPDLSETTVTLSNISSTYKFRAGCTYRWLAWG